MALGRRRTHGVCAHMELEQPTMTTDAYGTRSWRVNGLLHRTDGPAAIDADGPF